MGYVITANSHLDSECYVKTLSYFDTKYFNSYNINDCDKFVFYFFAKIKLSMLQKKHKDFREFKIEKLYHVK